MNCHISSSHAKESVIEKSLRDPIGIISGSVSGTYARFAQDISNILDKKKENKFRIVAVLGKGSQQNIADLLHLKGIGIAIPLRCSRFC